jgi:hypothetical protein
MKPTFSIGVLDLQMHSGDLFYVKPTQANINYLSQFWTVSVSSDQKYLSLATLQCVAITQAFSYAGSTGYWRRGPSKVSYSTPVNTPIASFYDGNTPSIYYGNNNRSHTGILVMHDRGGFFMLEQNWELPYPYDVTKPVGRLAVRFFPPSGDYQANAENYYPIHHP